LPESVPAAAVRPSGDTATARIHCVPWASRCSVTFFHLRASTSQNTTTPRSRALPDDPAESSHFPSVVNTSPNVCPCSACGSGSRPGAGPSAMRTSDASGLPVLASQSMIRPNPPDAITFPSGE
jgi:hypothetical protein